MEWKSYSPDTGPTRSKRLTANSTTASARRKGFHQRRHYSCSHHGCRITATFEFCDIRVRWNLNRDLPKYTPRFNVAPENSPDIPVIVRQKGVNECRLMHWELIPKNYSSVSSAYLAVKGMWS
jgi:hypothetical protein